jgi:hypothetical protein
VNVKRIVIHPSNTVQSAAAFTHEVEAMREAEPKKLVKAAREFFKSLESLSFKDLSTAHIQKMVNAHKLAFVLCPSAVKEQIPYVHRCQYYEHTWYNQK